MRQTTAPGVEMPEISDYSRRYSNLSDELFLAHIWSTSGAIERLRTRRDRELLDLYLKGPEILDFPIGSGRIYDHLVTRCNAYGYDVAEAFVEWNRRRYPGFAERFEVQSMERITNPRQFDTVVTMRVMKHLQDKALAIRNIAQIVKPGGRWIYTDGPQPLDLDKELDAAGFRVLDNVWYDVHSEQKSLPIGLRQIWTQVPRLARRGLMPYWLFRFLDWSLPSGTRMRVLEKSE